MPEANPAFPSVAAGKIEPEPGQIVVRMYRQGIGDCFLLAFATSDPHDPRYVLIDCGVHSSQTERSKLIRQILKDVKLATGGHLHLVVGTHEHYDHLMGFVDSKGGFDKFTVDRVWLAWTEDMTDDRAKELNKRKKALQQALGLACDKLKLMADSGDGSSAVAHQRLDRWLMWDDVEPLAAVDDEKLSTCEQAIRLLEKSLEAKVDYLRPGQRMSLSGVKDTRVYALGPPREDAHLKKSDPGTKSWGTYLNSDEDIVGLAMAVLGGLDEDRIDETLGDAANATLIRRLNALEWTPAAGTEPPLEGTAYRIEELAQPFDVQYRSPFKVARKDTFFWDNYFSPEEAWRRIGAGWSGAAEQLALHLNNHTNNTSLVLAFECGPPGDGFVFLFPGDAQLGNWRSWKALEWSEGDVKITTDDLLRRTWLHKVGHHASHNGSISLDDDGNPFGVALLPDDVISYIPVADKTAHGLGWHDMPFEPIVAELTKEKRNCLRADKSAPESMSHTHERETDSGIARVEFRVAEQTRKLKKKGEAKPIDDGPVFYDLVFTRPEA